MTRIRTISLEFLRPGPAHNHLLSPLTQYLGLCGNYGASTVQVPYEHQDFLSLLESLRYVSGREGNAQRRHVDLNKTADEMANILASVPGLVSGLGAASAGEKTMIHLDLILSASELAMLPFELSKVPPGCAGGEGNRLLLQTLLPICLTRRVRSVSRDNLIWPKKPKILFIIAQHRNMSVPATEHTRGLIKAMRPWIPESPPHYRKHRTSEMLTILPRATVEQIEAACANNVYTHVHILAHGMEDKKLPGQPYGLALHDPKDESRIEVVTGERLACALCPLRQQDASGAGSEPPAVVTIAACDSGNVGSVIYNNGASLAHALHQAGIPFVVASQFPLSKPGSILVAELLYGDMLWGRDPRVTLQQLRSRLYALSGDTHDWASLVTYAALPDDLELQLSDAQYVQARTAIGIATNQFYQTVDQAEQARGETDKDGAGYDRDVQDAIDQLESYVRRLEEAANEMPTTEDYATEGTGMLASAAKQKAEVYWTASLVATDERREGFLRRCLGSLQESLGYYREAGDENMRESTTPTRRRRSLHWVMAQYLSMRSVLGEEFLRDHWGAAMVSAQLDLEESSGVGRAWAHGTLAELHLMLLAYRPEHLPLKPEEIQNKTLDHVGQLPSLAGYDSFEVFSTKRQFRRYVHWWGHETFAAHLENEGRVRERSWTEPGGIVELADEVVKRLTR